MVPDLNVPSFENLSLAKQIELGEDLGAKLKDAPIVLVGSSMGGLLATLLERKINNVAAMILLAPGFGITRRWPQIVGAEGMAQWQAQGRRNFFHYGSNSERALHYQFALDLQNLQTENFRVKTPTIVFHGQDDQTVPLEHSQEFARLNADMVQIVTLSDGHELGQSLEQIWQESLKFLAEAGIGRGTASDTSVS